ncbi:hypothetical protein BJ742DRAFT_531428 [Cladochytrium replicatum]|nr:hypothetical protein BJ742DRAFT_531428 [Cladochytrium replicatum]
MDRQASMFWKRILRQVRRAQFCPKTCDDGHRIRCVFLTHKKDIIGCRPPRPNKTMPEFQNFSIVLDDQRTTWKLDDEFTAANLVKDRMNFETLRSRIAVLNDEIAQMYAGRKSHRKHIYVGLAAIVVAIIVCATLAVTLPKTSEYVYMAIVAVAVGVFVFVVFWWIRGVSRIANAFLERSEEIVRSFSDEDRAVGVNWVFKREDLPARGGSHGTRRRFRIEVQVWNGSIRPVEQFAVFKKSYGEV